MPAASSASKRGTLPNLAQIIPEVKQLKSRGDTLPNYAQIITEVKQL